jgi:hypothetical protein
MLQNEIQVFKLINLIINYMSSTFFQI